MRDLIPPGLLRHAAPAWLAGVAAVVAWGAVLLAFEALRGAGVLLDADTEGVLLLSAVAAASAASALLVELSVERAPRLPRVLEPLVGAAMAAWIAALGFALAGLLSPVAPPLALVGRVGGFVAAGVGASLGPLVPRLVRRVVEWAQVRWETRFFPEPPPLDAGIFGAVVLHGAAGLSAGLAAALASYQLGLVLGDRGLATLIGCWLLAVVPPLLVSGVPARAYRGWIRVLRGERAGWRVPLEPGDLVLSQRFVGSFPTGMDVHLPGDEGVAPLHAAVLASPDGAFTVRGISAESVRVVRFAEWVDLAADPTLPAPLETALRDGDRIRLGPTDEVELVLQLREDRA